VESFPARLRDLPSLPASLHVRGDLPRGPAVAIVGTRRPTPEAWRFARDLSYELALAGVAILSGGAEGIDTAAHRGALAARGVTVVIAPAGYDAPFPEENAALFRRIVASRGAYVSLVADDRAAHPATFFPRNACLAALAHALVVVQAPFRSGARNAAAWARRLGRPLLVVPSAPWVEEGRGCILELRRGAVVCDSARSVLKTLSEQGLVPIAASPQKKGAARRSASSPPAASSPVGQAELFETANISDRLPQDPIARRVLDAMRSESLQADDLCSRLGLTAAQVQSALLTLRLDGFLVPTPFGGSDRLTPQKC